MRSAAEASAPARECVRGDPPTARTTARSANVPVPAPPQTAAASTAAQAGANDAISATTSGPTMKTSSCSQASSA